MMELSEIDFQSTVFNMFKGIKIGLRILALARNAVKTKFVENVCWIKKEANGNSGTKKKKITVTRVKKSVNANNKY